MQDIGLVADGLEAQQAQHPLIGPHGPGGAVLHQQVRVTAEQIPIPLVQMLVVLPHGLGGTDRVQVAADPHGHVVIDLEMLRSVLPDEPFDHFRTVRPHVRDSEVQQIAAVVDMPFPVTADEPLVRETGGQGTGGAHDLDLDPQSHLQAPALSVLEEALQSMGKPRRALLPFAYPVPPVAVVVPARVDAVVFTAQGRRRVDERLLPLLVRRAPQTVHVIVEHHGRRRVVTALPPDDPAIPRQRRHRVPRVSRHCAEAHRDRDMLRARSQRIPPAVFRLRGPTERDIQPRPELCAVLDVPLPGVLHLEAPRRPGLPVLHQSHGQVFRRGPGSLARITVSVHAPPVQPMALHRHTGQAQVPAVASLPAAFTAPSVPRDIDVRLVEISLVSLAAKILIDERGDIFQRMRHVPLVLQDGPCPDHRRVPEELHMVHGGHTVVRPQIDLEELPGVRLRERMPHVPVLQGRARVVMFVSVHPTGGLPRLLDLQDRIEDVRFRCGSPNRLVRRDEMAQFHHAVVSDQELRVQAALLDRERHTAPLLSQRYRILTGAVYYETRRDASDPGAGIGEGAVDRRRKFLYDLHSQTQRGPERKERSSCGEGS